MCVCVRVLCVFIKQKKDVLNVHIFGIQIYHED